MEIWAVKMACSAKKRGGMVQTVALFTLGDIGNKFAVQIPSTKKM